MVASFYLMIRHIICSWGRPSSFFIAQDVWKRPCFAPRKPISSPGMMDNLDEPRTKRRRLSDGAGERSTINRRKLLAHGSLERPISPPPLRRTRDSQPVLKSSPFQMTRIQDLPESSNVDAVALGDILGDPLIAECWEFNYLHDLDFLMNAFDPDVRDLVKVNVVHGFWKREDQSRLALKVKSS